MDVILATRNPSKAHQVQTLFEHSGIIVHTLADAGVEGEAVEDGSTLEENAFKKARFAHEALQKKQWVMADDTGLFIHSLHGEPGIQAAYWGGAELSTEQRMEYCLEQLKECADRSATFRTFVALISPEGQEYSFTGEAEGTLLEAPRVPPQPKMPYSALFVPNAAEARGRSWAEMDTAEENAISHRGKAFAQVKEYLTSHA